MALMVMVSMVDTDTQTTKKINYKKDSKISNPFVFYYFVSSTVSAMKVFSFDIEPISTVNFSSIVEDE